MSLVWSLHSSINLEVLCQASENLEDGIKWVCENLMGVLYQSY